jgi:two-component system phosphate regulon sensor histidine kinase PhoR
VGKGAKGREPPLPGPPPTLKNCAVCKARGIIDEENMSEPGTILVADDEEAIRTGIARVLKSEGHQVLTAANGQEALEVLASGGVEVVLCDLKMPVMGAFEVLEETGRLYPEVPVVVITAFGTVNHAVECMKRGAYDFITKPYMIDHLILVVNRALEKQRLAREARSLHEEQAKNLYTLAMEQSRMHTMINCMADGVLVTNRNLEAVLVNRALGELLGLDSSLPLPGPLAAYVDDPALAETIRSLLAGAEGEEPEKCLFQEFKRGKTSLRVLTAPFHGPDEQVLGTISVFHDVTHFKELDEMKTTFVNLVSHELRSPLGAVKLQLSVIKDGVAGELNEKQQHLISRAQLKLEGLLALINDLLDVAKMEAGQRQLEIAPQHLEEILAEVVELLTAKARDQKITLKLSVPPGLSAILADRRGLEEIFTNLVSNAINYSPDGGEVRVAVNPRGPYLEALVSDQGVGIAPEEIDRIFTKFYRAKDPKTRHIVGTGLGLAIVQAMVEAHHGMVEVESQVGVGTTFKVLLPSGLPESSVAHAAELHA